MELPLWFLLLSLVLPRVSLLAMYFNHQLTEYNLGDGWVSLTLGVFIPRILVIILIYQDRGMSWWMVVHGLAIICVYDRGHTVKYVKKD